MSEDSNVWDLGEIDLAAAAAGARERARASTRTRREAVPAAMRSRARARNTIDWVAGLAVPFPGLAQFLKGRTGPGLLILSALGLVGALAWAVHATLDRFAATLDALGLPPHGAVWTLGALAAVGIGLHVVAVATCGADGTGAPHPAVSAAASAVVPGWGQVLNGDVGRAALFVAAAWVTAFSWVLGSPAFDGLLDSRALVLPGALETLASAPARAALTASVWLVAIHDAAQRSAWVRDRS